MMHINKSGTKSFAVSLTVMALCLHVQAVQALDWVDPPSHPVLVAQVQLAIEQYKLVDVYPDKTFRGERAFTRYELADALWRSLRYLSQRYPLPLPDGASLYRNSERYFEPQGDIPARHWAQSALQMVLGTGILGPESDRRFKGQQKVSRYQLALSLKNLLDYFHIQTLTLQQNRVSDVPADHWAAQSVNELVKAGILESAHHFKGDELVSRYELSQSLVKLLQHVDLLAQKGLLKPEAPPQAQYERKPNGRRIKVKTQF